MPDLVLTAILVLVFLMTVVIHEVSHGVVAYRLGDPTAKEAGRLTLNPLKHIDPFWTVILPLVLFVSTQGRFAIGMAKPVPVSTYRLRNPKTGMIWVALAGPAANLILAGLLNFVFRLSESEIVLYAVYFNLGLAMFNLVPIPPLDGSKIVAGLLPDRMARPYLRFQAYGYIAILLLYFSGILFHFLIPAMNFFCALMDLPRLRLN